MNIYILDKPSFSVSEFNKFLIDNDLDLIATKGAKPAENLVEAAGRICYMSFSSDPTKITYPNDIYIKEQLIAKGHESVIEHANWTFILTGVSRGFTHQLVRHRVGFSYSQLSQQYFQEDNAQFIVPSLVKNNLELKEIWDECNERSLATYRKILDSLNGKSNSHLSDRELKRQKNSAARTVLPNAMETKIVVTANARALRHFFKLRGAIMGDEEMRIVSYELFKLVSKDAPILFSDFIAESKCTEDGKKIVRFLGNNDY